MSITESDLQEWRQSDVTRLIIKSLQGDVDSGADALINSARTLSAEALQQRARDLHSLQVIVDYLSEVSLDDL